MSNDIEGQIEPRRASTATRAQVEAFVRGMLARSEHANDCWHCGGKRFVKPANGTSAPARCGECKSAGLVSALVLAVIVQVRCFLAPGAPFVVGDDGWKVVERTAACVTVQHEGPLPLGTPCPIGNRIPATVQR